MLSTNISQMMRRLCPLVLIVAWGCGRSAQSPSEDAKGLGQESLNSTQSQGRGEPDDQVLAEEDRKHLWDVEHLGFVLEQTVFPKLKSNLSSSDFADWKTFASEGCSVTVSDKLRVRSFLNNQFEYLEFNGLQNRNSELEVIPWLRKLRDSFSPSPESCKASIGLVRLTPVDASDLTKKFKSVWRLRLTGEKDSQPVEMVLELQLDLDHLVDDIAEHEGWITSISVLKQKSHIAERPFFEEVTASSGLSAADRHDNWDEPQFEPNTGGLYVTDYDQDGHLDIYIDDLKAGGRLYRGRGNATFEDVTAEAGLLREGHSPLWALSAWADLDNDGDDDLIAEDRLYENLGNGHFRDISSEANLPLTPAAGYAVGDFNCDGLIDLYVCHTSAYRTGQVQKSRVKWIDDGLGIDNVLLRNHGDWKFEDVTVETKTGGGGSSCFSAVWINANGDRWPDLFAINEFGKNSLLINLDGEKFSEQTIDPVFGGFSMGVAAGDYDNDGLTDVYVANMYSKAGNRILDNVDVSRYPKELHAKITEGTKGSKLYRNLGDGEYETVPAEEMVADVGWAYGPTFFDLDNDGWLDLYATAGFKSVKRGEPDG